MQAHLERGTMMNCQMYQLNQSVFLPYLFTLSHLKNTGSSAKRNELTDAYIYKHA